MIKIVSGAQTGVDRGALDAALDAGVSCGGWCPKGRKAEDGPIADRYPLTEMSSSNYPKRTRQNVLDSDATLIIHYGALSGGTDYTRRCCLQHKKPCVLIDALELDPLEALEPVLDFIAQNQVKTLNVAGPRASNEPRSQAYSYELISGLLNKLLALTAP